MPDQLPTFTFHPDPVATGVVEAREGTCAGCGLDRGWLYALTPYAQRDLRDRLCPWCIADGTAAERFGARFTIVEPGDVPEGVPAAVVEAIATRTPGFAGWQRERWLFHCGDGAEYLGPVGWDEIEGDEVLVEALLAQAHEQGLEGDLAVAFVGSLDVDGAATAYRFRCRVCGTSLGYADTDDD